MRTRVSRSIDSVRAVAMLGAAAASLLVLASVVASSRARQVFEATVMHAVGARLSSLRRVLYWEYLLLAGSTLATALLQWRLDMSPAGLYWTGLLTAAGVSALSLGMGARYLLAQMRLNPAMLLRSGG
jgi:putative ABC transport system permease protein